MAFGFDIVCVCMSVVSDRICSSRREKQLMLGSTLLLKGYKVKLVQEILKFRPLRFLWFALRAQNACS